MRYIGIDLHTDNFTAVCINKRHEQIFCEKFDYNISGLNDFRKKLKIKDKLAVEATANSPDIIEKLQPYIQSIIAVAPSKFQVISKSTKKTDKNDAHAIALFLAKDLLPKARIKKEISRHVLSMVDTRALLVKSRTCYINKIYAILVQNGHKIKKSDIKIDRIDHTLSSKNLPELSFNELCVLKDQILHLHESIEQIENEIFEQSHRFKHYETLLSVPGFGKLSATIMSAIIENIDDFPSAGHLCSYFGIVPKISVSNDKSKTGGISKQGTKLGRTTLVQSTWVAIRCNTYLKQYYERLKKKKCPQKAIIATSRKLLIILYHAMAKNIIYTDFEKNEYTPNIK